MGSSSIWGDQGDVLVGREGFLEFLKCSLVLVAGVVGKGQRDDGVGRCHTVEIPSIRRQI